MASYIFSASLESFLRLAIARMERGFGATLLLEGPPGGGKTSFAKAVGDRLRAPVYYYAGSPDKERDLLYEIDVEGVLRRERAWVPGPAWQSFTESAEGRFAVLLIDEVDKTSGGFDAFLLRLLEDWKFRSPGGEEIAGDPTHLCVILTSNGRRKLRPEVLRRVQRVHVPLPDNGRQAAIIRQIAGRTIPDDLLQLLIRLGEAVRADEEESAPSPKELALAASDLLTLAEFGEQGVEIFGEVAASYLTKSPERGRHLDKVAKFRWAKALREEANKSGASAPIRDHLNL